MEKEFKDEMHEFKNDYLQFKDEMYEFKDEMYEFKNDYLEFKDEMYEFKQEMYEFKEEVYQRFDKQDTILASLQRSILIIEDYVTNKIPALFDAYALNQDQHINFDNKINNLELNIYNQSK